MKPSYYFEMFSHSRDGHQGAGKGIRGGVNAGDDSYKCKYILLPPLPPPPLTSLPPPHPPALLDMFIILLGREIFE
jgi:hypothetical protein